jgi:hypothetical protein
MTIGDLNIVDANSAISVQLLPAIFEVEAPSMQRARYDRAFDLGPLHRTANVRAERIEREQTTFELCDDHALTSDSDGMHARLELGDRSNLDPFVFCVCHGPPDQQKMARLICARAVFSS